jgi:tetratricopeptide (TPR) repeat protein
MLGEDSVSNLIGSHYIGPAFEAINPEVQFYVIYVYLRLYIKGDLDFSELKSLLNEYEDEYSDRAPFLLLKSDVFRRGYSQRHYREAIKAAHDALKIGPENTRYILAFVDSTLKYIRGSPDLELDIDELPEKREELLEVIDEYSYRAVSQAPESIHAHSTRSNVLELQGDFKSAERELNQALKIANQNEDRSTHSLEYQLSVLRRNRETANRAERALSEVKEDIDSLREESENIEQKLRQDMESYRNQMLQFIVFFTGILAVIFISIQVSLQLQSVADAMRVVVVLTGSITVAFSVLNITVFGRDEGSRVPSWVLSLVLGILLILFGYFLPELESLI